MSHAVHIALVEDHPATRAALERELVAATDCIASVRVYADGEALLRDDLRKVEVALIDLKLPGMSGAQVIARLAVVAPHVRAVAITVFDDGPTVLEVISAGAVGYLLKTEPRDRLMQAIAEAAEGHHPFSSRVAGFLLTHLRHPASTPLTDRELELASILAEGASYQDAATHLGIALGTVQHHVKNIYRKLDINSKQQVAAWVKAQGRRT